MATKRPTKPLATFTVRYRFNSSEYTTVAVAHDADAVRARFLRDNPNVTILTIT